jgi:hypothetical protein
MSGNTLDNFLLDGGHMRIHIGALALGLGSALALGACAGTQKPALSPRLASTDCAGVSSDSVAQLYAPGTIKEVTPLYRKRFVARAIQPIYPSGAMVSIPAQPGMTDAYLERALSCHAASHARTGTTDAADPLAVSGIDDVDVKSVGSRTQITITSTDSKAARQIVQHAKTLQQSGGSVSVEQLSFAVPAAGKF